MKLLITSLVLYLLNGNYSTAPAVFYSSKAFDSDSKKLVYYENHKEFVNQNNERIWKTNYVNKTGDLLSKRVIELDSDSLRPDYVLQDFRTGYLEGSEKIGNDLLHIFTKDDENSSIERDTIKIDDSFVVDAGLTFFFRKNWDRLLSGEKVRFNFVAPAKLDYFKFRVYKNRIYNFFGKEVMELVLEPSGFILRQFVDSIVISYYLDTKEIASYKGVSNVLDEEGKNYNVLISYLDYKNGADIWRDLP